MLGDNGKENRIQAESNGCDVTAWRAFAIRWRKPMAGQAKENGVCHLIGRNSILGSRKNHSAVKHEEIG